MIKDIGNYLLVQTFIFIKEKNRGGSLRGEQTER